MTLLEKLLAERAWLLADGATGTNLFGEGLEAGYPPDLWNLENPDKIRTLYRNFISAGSDIILTNSFGANSYRLKLHQADDRVFEINKAAAELAHEEVKKSGRDVVVAGSMGPTGEILQPVGLLSYEDCVESFREQAVGLKAGGADVAWIETMSAENEVSAAIEGARLAGLKAVSTLSFDTAGRTMMGITPQAYPQMVQNFSQVPIAIGANCGVGPSELVATILGLTHDHHEHGTDMPAVVAKGNCGMPQFVGGECVYSGTPELMAKYAIMAFDAGARIIGGCCGTKPEHLVAMRKALEEHTKGSRPTIDDITVELGEVSDLAKGKAANQSNRGERTGRRRKEA